jgi:hypothetical protein
MKLMAGRQRSVYGIFNVTKKGVVAAVASGLKSVEGDVDAILGGSSDDGEGKENGQPSPSL